MSLIATVIRARSAAGNGPTRSRRRYAAASNSSDFNDIANSCEKRWCLTKNKSCQDGLRLTVTKELA